MLYVILIILLSLLPHKGNYSILISILFLKLFSHKINLYLNQTLYLFFLLIWPILMICNKLYSSILNKIDTLYDYHKQVIHLSSLSLPTNLHSLIYLLLGHSYKLSCFYLYFHFFIYTFFLFLIECIISITTNKININLNCI